MGKKEKHDYLVYVHTVKENGKRYVGISKQSALKRWQRGDGYSKQFFGKVIREYGWRNIKHEILYTNLTEEEAIQWEQALIAMWKTTDINYGYNITEGGNTVRFSDEQVEKMYKPVICLETLKTYKSIKDASETVGISHSRISVCCSGKRNIAKGFHWSYYDKEKSMSYYENLLKEKIEKEKDKSDMPVILVDTKQIFQSIKEAVRQMGLNSSHHIVECCEGKLHSAFGYHWAYYDETKPISYYDTLSFKGKNSTSVQNLDTGETFETVEKAAKSVNLSRSAIVNCCKGITKTAGGHHWKYIDKRKEYNHNLKKPVICLDTMEIFDSVASISYENKNHVSCCCRNKRITANGLHWMYYDKNKPIEYYQNIPLRKVRKHHRSVELVELGKTFSTIREASKYVGISEAAISKCLKGKLKTAGGYHWRDAD